MKSFRAHLHLKEGSKLRFCRPRTVPFAIKNVVGKALDSLEEAGIVIKKNYSERAAPIVPVPKQDGSIWVCGDFKVTINPYLNVDQYALPKPTDLMTCLTGAKTSTKLDLTAAYQQMLLDKCSFFKDSVEYLGHHISADGVHTTKEKTQAISEAPKPRNVQELRSFLGLLNYDLKFIPNLASLLHP